MVFRPLDALQTVPGTVSGAGSPRVGAQQRGYLEPGSSVDRYEVCKWLGEGATAAVYLVRHQTLESEYALKVLQWVSPGLRERLVMEGQLQSKLEHPNIVRVHDVFEVGETLALLLDYVPGESLAEWLRKGPMEFDQAEALFRQILEAVEFAHQQGVIHRDLKPANVMLTERGGEIWARVTDFGIAKHLEEEVPSTTRTGALMGTLEYMAPEQLRGEPDVDGRADLFALGVLLYELCLGTRPFADKHLVQLVSAIEKAEYRPLEEVCPEMPGHLERAIQSCLVAEKERRVPDGATLRSILDGENWEPPKEKKEQGRLVNGEEKSQPGGEGDWKKSALVGMLALMTLIGVGAVERHISLEKARAAGERQEVDSKEALAAAGLGVEAWARVGEAPAEALALFRAADARAQGPSGISEPLLEAELLADLLRRGAAVRHFPFEDQVSRVAYSPDGQWIAAGSLSGTVVIFDVATGEERSRFDAEVRERLMGLFFTPDGSRLVVLPGATDSTPDQSDPARIFDAHTGELLHSLSHGRRTVSVEINHDSTLGATLGFDHRVLLWDLSTGTPRKTLRGKEAERFTHCLAFSPVENLLAGGSLSSPDRPAWFLYQPDGEGGWKETLLELPERFIGDGECQVRFSPDGKYLLGATGLGLLRWDLETLELVGKVPTTTWRVLEIDPGGASLVQGTRQGAVILRSLPDLEEIGVLRAEEGTISRVTYGPGGGEGQWLVTAGTDGVVRLFSAETGDELARWEGNRSWVLGLSTAVHAESVEVATAGRDGVLRVWQLDAPPPRVQKMPRRSGEERAEVVRYHWDPQGRELLLGTGMRELLQWDLGEEAIPGRHFLSSSILSLAGTRGSMVALVLRNGEVQVRKGEEVLRRYQLDLADGVYLSPQGEEIVVTRSHGILIEEPGGEEPFREVTFPGKLRQVALDWERDQVVVVDQRNQLTRIDLKEAGPPLVLPLGYSEGAALALSADGKRALVGFWSGGAELWDLDRGERIADLKGHGDSVTEVAFSPDGSLAVTGGGDAYLRIWDGETGEWKATLRAHRRPLIDLAFSPAGDRLATVGMDRKLCLWDLGREVLLSCEGLSTLPVAVRFSREEEGERVRVLDERYRVWSWIQKEREESSQADLGAGARTNLRVCSGSTRVVAVLPFPEAETVWAPEYVCQQEVGLQE